MTKSLADIIKNDTLGTIYRTDEIFSSKDFITEALGDNVRFVGVIGVFEGSNEVLMELKIYANDFDKEKYEDNDEELNADTEAGA